MWEKRICEKRKDIMRDIEERAEEVMQGSPDPLVWGTPIQYYPLIRSGALPSH
jgi:hypothetical protein